MKAMEIDHQIEIAEGDNHGVRLRTARTSGPVQNPPAMRLHLTLPELEGPRRSVWSQRTDPRSANADQQSASIAIVPINRPQDRFSSAAHDAEHYTSNTLKIKFTRSGLRHSLSAPLRKTACWPLYSLRMVSIGWISRGGASNSPLMAQAPTRKLFTTLNFWATCWLITRGRT